LKTGVRSGIGLIDRKDLISGLKTAKMEQMMAKMKVEMETNQERVEPKADANLCDI
jgi:hypothetical protein